MIEYGVFKYEGIPVVESKKLAEIFGIKHKCIVRNIRKIVRIVSKLFTKRNIILLENGEYLLTKDGFTMLNFNTKDGKVIEHICNYISEFSKMAEE